MLAVIRTRGSIGMPGDVQETLERLRLRACNQMVVVADNESVRGSLFKANPYITYGTISEEMFAHALQKRGKTTGDKKLDEAFFKQHKLKGVEELAKEVLAGKKKLADFAVKPVFRLHPPKKGFERKGIKTGYNAGGVWGDRKEKINELIGKMA